MKKIVALLSFACITLLSNAQVTMPQMSPLLKETQTIGLTEFTLEFSRPGARDRHIFGDLVPYDVLWRTGANASTKIAFDDDIVFGGLPVSAGTYALYTIPSKNEWIVILSSNLNHWGTGGDDYKPEEEVVRFKISPSKQRDYTETFTIDFEDIKVDGSATLRLAWEKTEILIPVQTEVEKKVEAQIASLTDESSWRAFYNASIFYNNIKADYEKALIYVDKALAKESAFYVLHFKAKILLELKDYEEAKKVAIESKAAAVQAKNIDYVNLNEKLIKKIDKAS